jgi:putative FmdB family regulatory protein
MPTYEYVCEKCGHRYEKFQNMSAVADSECPKCGCEVKRLIGTGAGFIFKGSGFYQTDYKKAAKPADCPSCPSCSTCPSAKD